MSNNLQLNESPKQPRRRRSTSLDSKVIIKYRENNICQTKIPEKQMKKYASSSSLFNPENLESEKIPNSPRLKHKLNLDCNCNLLFFNWLKDFKSVKPLLLNLHDPNIFKNQFPRHNDLNLKEFYPPLVFFVINNLKIDNEYEVIDIILHYKLFKTSYLLCYCEWAFIKVNMKTINLTNIS